MPTIDQTGELCAPFATIQQALDEVDEILPWAILCSPGIYDEDLVVPARVHVRISPWGGTTENLGAAWTQAVSSMLFLGPPDLSSLRTITWNSPGPAVDPTLTPFFGFQGFVSDGIVVTDGGVENTLNILFVWEFVGVGGVDASGHDTGGLIVRIEGASIAGPVLLADNNILAHARNAFFGDLVTAHVMEEVHDCNFQAGFDSSPADVTATATLFNCKVQGTVTNCNNFILDGATEYWHRRLSGATPFAGSTAYVRADDPLESDISIDEDDTPYTIVSAEVLRVIYVNTAVATVDVLLPATPIRGDEYKIKDDGGTAGTNNITLDGNGNLIDGAATVVIAADWEDVWVKWNVTAGEWRIL